MSETFKKDIRIGLQKPNKKIESKYFYDGYGCQLFDRITRHPDYYLTQCEIDILTLHKHDLAIMPHGEPFNLVELGPGEGIKTQILLEHFLSESLHFTYIPIDISLVYLNQLVNKFKKQLPGLKVMPIHADYFNGLKWLNAHSTCANLVLFLGSSIGNFGALAIKKFLSKLKSLLHPKDYVLLGFDLRKNVDVLMRAYNDSDGITREFNFNILKRINRELGGNFDLNKFQHYPTYNVYSGAMESYLISLEVQNVFIEALNQSFSFQAVEPIHVECSYKYQLSQIKEIANAIGFIPLRAFVDPRQYFVDALWRV